MTQNNQETNVSGTSAKRTKPPEDPVARGCRLHERAVSLRADGKYPQAEAVALQALAVMEKAVGKGHPDVANLLNNLGSIYTDTGDYTAAEPIYQRSIRILAEVAGEDADLQRLRVQSRNNLATLYRMQGRYAEAEPVFKTALALAKKSFGPEDLEVSTTLNNLGVLYKYMGRCAEALTL